MGELILSTIVVTVNDKKIGIKLKQARLESGLSQEQVGAKLGVTWEMVSRYENGRTSPLKHIENLANIYRKPISYFLDTPGEKQESFSIDQLVTKLKDEGIGFTTSSRNVIKVLTKFSGRGIERDLMDTTNFYEVSTSLTDNFPNAFALKIGPDLDVQVKDELRNDDVAIFNPGTDARPGEVVVGYDGIRYKVMKYDDKGMDTPLAVLIAVERRYRNGDSVL